MTPEIDRTLPPSFSAMSALKFQDFCAELMYQDSIYRNPVVYGRNGQDQKGIDILAPLRDTTGVHVAQCKAWAKPSPKEIRDASTGFLADLEFWRAQNLKKFILVMGCRLDDQKSH